MESIKLYGATFSYFVRAARLMCNIKGLDHEVTQAPFGEEIAFFGEQHQQLNTFKKMPVLIQGDLILPETTAIARYLDTLAEPALFPPAPADKAKVDALATQLSIYAARAVVADVILEFAFPKGENGEVRLDVAKAALPNAQETLAWISRNIGDRHYFYGDHFTACDAYVIPMLDYLLQLPEPFNQIDSNLQRYYDFHKHQSYCQGVLGPKQ